MTYYAKFTARGRYSTSSDYSNPSVDTGAFDTTLTPTEAMYRRVVASTGAQTMDLGDFTTITGVMVRNRSTTTAEVAWITVHQQISSASGVNVVFTDANPDTIALAGQLWVTTQKAAAGMYVRVASTSNTGTYLIQTAANEQLTLGADEALTGATENATLYFQSKNTLVVQAGGTALITGSISPANDLIYRAASASSSVTPELEILIVGA